MRGRRSGRGCLRKIFFARRRYFACLFDPVLAERALHVIDDRSFDAKAGIAPVLFVLRLSGPLLRDAVAADVADAAVDDHQLAMVAIVEAPDVREVELV